jgi:hypothetical protein
MPGGRQAWCPWCDELRPARPGSGCPVCRRRLLPLPPARPGQPRPGPRARASARLRALAPAAGAVGAGLLIAVAVAGSFTVGRLTRDTPTAPAAAPATTLPGFTESGPLTGFRELNWPAERGGVQVKLRSVAVGVGFTRLALNVAGLAPDERVNALHGLRVRDARGNDLLPEIDRLSTASDEPGPSGSVDTEVVLDRAIDQQAVAAVEVRELLVAEDVAERLGGTLVDPELQRRFTEENADWTDRPDCPGCRLQARCRSCRTIRLAGTAYRDTQVVLLLEPVGAAQRSALNPQGRQVEITLPDDPTVELDEAWSDGGDGGSAVVVFSGHELIARGGACAPPAPRGCSPADANGKVAFEVRIDGRAERVVDGPWSIGQPGAAP